MNRLIALILFTLMFTSCAKAPQISPPLSMSFERRSALLNQITNWQIKGKVAVRTAHDSGSTSVDWDQNRSHYTITLYGAFGSGGLKLIGKPRGVTLIAEDGKTYQSNSAEQLLATVWGFRLPVSNLKFWIRGLPAPTAPYQNQFDDENHISRLIQQGYLIDYLAYKRIGNVDLPTRMTITSSALNVKLVIYDWQI